MKMRLMMNISAVVCLALLATGCSKVPFEELKAAQKAREEAREISQQYAPDAYDEALALYDEARTEIEAQNSKAGFMRNYARAVELLGMSQQGFKNAFEMSMAAMERVKSEAQEKSTAAATALEETRQALEGVRRTSRNRADRERWRQEIESMTYSLEDADEYLSSEYYKESIGYYDTILADCERVRTEISGG